MKRRICSIVALASLIVFCLGGCSGDPTSSGQPSPEQSNASGTIDLNNLSVDMLKIAGGASGGMYYTLSTAVAQEVERNTNITFQVEATEGGSANVVQVSNNPLVIGMTSTPLIYEGETQTGWASDAPQAYTGLCALFPCYPSAFACYALASSGIETIEDLEGKTVCLGPAGSSYNWQLQIYETAGVNIEPVSMAWSDAVNSLKDGTIDACSFSGAHPFSSCVEVQLTNDVNFIQLDDETLEAMVAADPTRPIVSLEAETYACLDEAYKTLCEYSFFMCNEELPEDVAYAITKIAIENADTLNLAVAAAKDINPESLSNISTAKLHPGAYRYYQEIGADVPEWMIP